MKGRRAAVPPRRDRGPLGNDGLIHLMTLQEGTPKPDGEPVDRVRRVYGREGGLFGVRRVWVALLLVLGVLGLFLRVLFG